MERRLSAIPVADMVAYLERQVDLFRLDGLPENPPQQGEVSNSLVREAGHVRQT